MYTPHTVTVYNVIQETDLATFEEVERVYITILRGVFLDASKARNVNESGLVSADAVDLFIPFSVEAVGADGTGKTYVGPQEFWAKSHAEREHLWTLSVEGNGGETFFVKGDINTLFAPADYDGVLTEDNMMYEAVKSDAYLIASAARALDDSYTVTKVDTKDFGRPSMQHWQVGGA